MLNVAMIGLGGISTVHRNAYEALKKDGRAQLVAVVDIDPKAINRVVATNLDSDRARDDSFHFYTSIDEMLCHEKVDFIDVCTPTYTHKEVATSLLKRGIPVLCEKPMALSVDDTKEMINAAETASTHLMVAQCVRFFKEYVYLKQCIEDERFGKMVSAFFQRLSPPPVWGRGNWYMDVEKSGGCILDLHIHDVDVVRYIFGEPRAVSCRTAGHYTKYDVAHTCFLYENVPVTIIGDWSLKGVKFAPSFRISFEEATMIYEKGVVTVYPKDGTPAFTPEIPMCDGYAEEIRYFCDVVEGKCENVKCTAQSAAKSVELVEVLKKSSAAGGTYLPFS